MKNIQLLGTVDVGKTTTNTILNNSYLDAISISELDLLKSLFTNKSIDNNKTRKLSNNLDIQTEYQLIKNKKSTLSKWERNEVVKLYELK